MRVTFKSARPAGSPDQCFYCKTRVGLTHNKDCPLIIKKVLVKASIEYEVTVPNHWVESNIEFHRNDSSWCASNMIDELKKLEEDGSCLCSMVKYEYIKDKSGPFLEEG